MKYYSAIKKKKILPFATAWMDLENIMFGQFDFDMTLFSFHLCLFCLGLVEFLQCMGLSFSLNLKSFWLLFPEVLFILLLFSSLYGKSNYTYNMTFENVLQLSDALP